LGDKLKMRKVAFRWLFISLLALSLANASAYSQSTSGEEAELRTRRNAIEAELQSLAVVERKVMVTMRDGKRMQADIYRPKGDGKYPIIFSRTPYNFNWWDVRLGAPRDMTTVLDAIKRGYAYVIMNERGRYFSEGDYDILGPPTTDGEDAINYLTKQPW